MAQGTGGGGNSRNTTGRGSTGQGPRRPDPQSRKLQPGKLQPGKPQPGKTQPGKTQPRKPATYRPVGRPERRGGIGRPVVIVAVIVTAVLAYFIADRGGETPVPQPPQTDTTQPATTTASPEQSAARAPREEKPAPSLAQATAASEPKAPVVPAEFLKIFEDYKARPGEKAIALALDGGRFSYSVTEGKSDGKASQSEVNEAALAVCEKQRAEGKLNAPCRLYAIGDKVVW